MNTTVITGFFNINRETHGDGRKLDDYIIWLKKTMLLNIPMVIFCELDTYNVIAHQREHLKHTKFIIIDDVYYFKYLDTVQEISKNKTYLKNIKGKDRLEIKLPIYNLLILNKIIWLKQVADENYFNSKYFLWMDAGCSRFFGNIDLNELRINENKLADDKLNIQLKKTLLNDMSLFEIMHHNDHFTTATLFGGTEKVINIFKVKMHEMFIYMLNNNCINNEQIILAMIYKNCPHLFNGFLNTTSDHLPYFKYIFI